MTEESRPEKPTSTIGMPMNDFLSVVILGGIIGLSVWGLTFILNRYVFDAYFCGGGTSDQCSSAGNYAAMLATIIGAVAALVALIRLRIYRPLLIVLAAAISLWGLAQYGLGLAWYQMALVLLVMYALALVTYGWIARLRQFWIALIATVVLVLLVRIAFML